MQQSPGRIPLYLYLLVTLVALAPPFAAHAEAGRVEFDVRGINNDSLVGTVGFQYDAAQGTIHIDITNTSEAGGGPDPRITGFAFNAPANVTGVSAFSSTPVRWSLLWDRDSVNTPQSIGLFDVGATSSNGNGINGGSPRLGIALNQTFNFVFTLSGTDLSSLSEASFLSLLSDLGGRSGTPTYFAVRFQQTGQNRQGSDVGVPGGGGGSDSSVPEPAALLLVGAGLVARLWIRRRN